MISFAPPETYSGKRLENIKAGSDFYDMLNWKKNYQSITVKEMGKVGDEDVYIIRGSSRKARRSLITSQRSRFSCCDAIR